MAYETQNAPAEVAAVPAAEATETTHAVTETAGHGESGGGGLPQFRFEYWGGQIVWLLIIFAVLYLLISKVFAPRLRGVLDARAETIASALEQARKAQAEADAQAAQAQAEIEEGRNQSRRVAADAKAKAAAELATSQAAEDERLSGEMTEAEARIRKTRDAAMASVGAIADETAEAIVQKLTGKAVTAAELKSARTQGAA